jgi:mRNA interferase MazF
MPYSQGDIVIVPFPFSDLSSAKPRPAIIISNKKVNKTNDVIIAQITTNIRKDEFSFELIESELSRSLRSNSEVRCNKITTIDQSLIKRQISKLTPVSVTTLLKQIKSLL